MTFLPTSALASAAAFLRKVSMMDAATAPSLLLDFAREARRELSCVGAERAAISADVFPRDITADACWPPVPHCREEEAAEAAEVAGCLAVADAVDLAAEGGASACQDEAASAGFAAGFITFLSD
mmetsp:Transcript_99417/g.179454  ORF Transcript_99417/g.179454 Transcript_99417/m.179454 type:complete len:125 (+) Transcript_99417:1182-1556(+)